MGFHWNQCGARLSQSVWIFRTCCFPQPPPMEERGDPEFDETQHVYIPWKSGDNARHDHIEIWTRRSPFLSVSRACLSTLVFFLGNVEGRWIPFLLFFKKVLDSLHFTLKVQDHIPRHQKHTATSSLRVCLLFFNFNFILQCFIYQKIILFFNACYSVNFKNLWTSLIQKPKSAIIFSFIK